MFQFSEDSAERMKQVYGDFCSHHTEAVGLFKELQQQNKKLQVFVKVRPCCRAPSARLATARGMTSSKVIPAYPPVESHSYGSSLRTHLK